VTVNSSGLVTGVAAGQATISATYPNSVVLTGQICGPNASCPTGNPGSSIQGNALPRIDNITPSRGLIGSTVSSFTITGQGFTTGGHVNTPAAMQVNNITTFTDTQIKFDLVISTSATTGNNAGAISVTASGETSNAKDFYVQVPTILSIVPGSAAGTTEKLCTSNACGTIVSFTYQVKDQDSTPQPINAVMSDWDSFATFNPDPLGMNSAVPNTTCTFNNMTNSGPCGVSTKSDGTFGEGALGACSTVCYNGACITGGPSTAAQTWHIAASTIAQQIGEYCQKVTVTALKSSEVLG